ncbi:hypothetical protein EJ05DRAFT_435581 [Pseudovirgaria hyperparasitica]|uniref:protein-tyrosine-phosphatase n=1 Tax=Pseudovirgaria hyperparasitica TaxID=470096 RepID=A0A6A6WGU5_9PEZI|nr:uncharacterized protein EJ05DRAFT_435581 [Pseudovirgaria hyperparasitica]KAF2761315.1 hypothetical protein EJ05DRAFT_435581 [Pseudovirgaria hyperparasitica]
MAPPAFTTLPIHQDPRTPSPNYFGMSFDSQTDVFASNSDTKTTRSQLSPHSIQSVAAASPLPVESNPAFAAFRKQSSEHGSGFALGRLHSFDGVAKSLAPQLPASPISPKRPSPPNQRPAAILTTLSNLDTPTKPRSPKRQHSDDSDIFPDRVRRNSPASFTDSSSVGSFQDASFFSPDKSDRPSLPPQTLISPISSHSRSETLPEQIDIDRKCDGPAMITPQRLVNLLDSAGEEILLLDLRVSTQYAKARIIGALSLCIPTTLIKRPSFNVAKLAETFKDEESKKKFEGWRNSKYIIVYDAESSTMKDATICINTLKKFASEGWNGASYIIRGGFREFSESFSSHVSGDAPSGSNSRNTSVSTDASGPSIAPVIGGCPMPLTENAANPFFGNIRQNMDLIGGVGQMSLKRPAAMTPNMEGSLPFWLNQAIDQRNDGKLVADKFLHIEKREQRRMQEALSGHVSYGTPSPGASRKVKIAGIEKGSKNRYNNIWPYEHSRVRLQGVTGGACDYINASHVSAGWSNKKYIATQAPIPSTFDDFWNTVWQQDARVIVMLTAEHEGGQVKAHNYWSGKQYGQLRLNFLSEHRASLELSRIHRKRNQTGMDSRQSSVSPVTKGFAEAAPTSDQPFVIVRKFTLSHCDHPFERMREITQLQYSSWPDFGAPAHPAHLLGLVEQTNAVVRSYNGTKRGVESSNSRPIVVHCSAGCGRTGTFCTVDTVIDMIRQQHQEKTKRQSSNSMDIDSSQGQDFFFGSSSDGGVDVWKENDSVDLIEKTAEEFRHQRLSMVQSLRQYVLCYETVLEWLIDEQQHAQ